MLSLSSWPSPGVAFSFCWWRASARWKGWSFLSLLSNWWNCTRKLYSEVLQGQMSSRCQRAWRLGHSINAQDLKLTGLLKKNELWRTVCGNLIPATPCTRSFFFFLDLYAALHLLGSLLIFTIECYMLRPCHKVQLVSYQRTTILEVFVGKNEGVQHPQRLPYWIALTCLDSGLMILAFELLTFKREIECQFWNNHFCGQRHEHECSSLCSWC